MLDGLTMAAVNEVTIIRYNYFGKNLLKISQCLCIFGEAGTIKACKDEKVGNKVWHPYLLEAP